MAIIDLVLFTVKGVKTPIMTIVKRTIANR
jgi:hypothetical protein